MLLSVHSICCGVLTKSSLFPARLLILVQNVLFISINAISELEADPGCHMFSGDCSGEFMMLFLIGNRRGRTTTSLLAGLFLIRRPLLFNSRPQL